MKPEEKNDSIKQSKPPAESYSPPTLLEIGDAVELTQGNFGGHEMDAPNQFERTKTSYATTDC